MCYGLPAKSLDQAKQRLTPEQWSRFEREFEVFCVVQGLVKPPEHLRHVQRYTHDLLCAQFDWARWAFFQGRGCSDRTADQRVADAKYTRVAIAMMDDEQAVASLERWKQVNLERGA